MVLSLPILFHLAYIVAGGFTCDRLSMACVMISFLFTERTPWERQKEASNRLQKEAVLYFIIMWHQCQVKYIYFLLELTAVVTLWSSLPGNRHVVENYTKGFMCWHHIFFSRWRMYCYFSNMVRSC
jgi:hypothetical protein